MLVIIFVIIFVLRAIAFVFELIFGAISTAGEKKTYTPIAQSSQYSLPLALNAKDYIREASELFEPILDIINKKFLPPRVKYTEEENIKRAMIFSEVYFYFASVAGSFISRFADAKSALLFLDLSRTLIFPYMFKQCECELLLTQYEFEVLVEGRTDMHFNVIEANAFSGNIPYSKINSLINSFIDKDIMMYKENRKFAPSSRAIEGNPTDYVDVSQIDLKDILRFAKWFSRLKLVM